MNYKRSFYEIKSNEFIFEELQKERENIGYYTLPYQDVNEIIEYSKTIKQKDIVIVGIGGSSLGTYAIHQFLKVKNPTKKKLHFLESTDPLDINQRLNKIDLKNALFLVVSKSGTTIETISIFKYLSSIVKMSKENCVIISELDSKLSFYANKHNMKIYEIPKNVGGRFSVFSSVGLLPLCLAGYDIKKIVDSIKEVNESFFQKGEYFEHLFSKARFLVENKSRFNINVLFSYSSALEGFNKWYIQLWGESLGKININGTKQGLTPIGLIGPVDQHSFLQLIAEGKRDKTVTFIKVEDFESDIKVPIDSLDGFEDLDYVEGIEFKDIITKQCDSTIRSLEELKDIPYDVITINKVNEENIAKLMYSYQLLTSVVGKFTQIDTYNQPGVERGKVILKDDLKKESK